MSAPDRLIYKYKLSHLKKSQRYDEELIWGATTDEEKRFKEYKKEKETLLENVKELPYYNIEKYSLFVISTTWNYYSMKSHIICYRGFILRRKRQKLTVCTIFLTDY